MGLQHRKIIRYSIQETPTDICSSYCNSSDSSSFCQPPCLTSCPSYCHNLFQSLIPSPSPVTFKYHVNHTSRRFLIITASFLATTFVTLLCYVIFVKFYLGSRRRSSSQPRIINETNDNFLDEDHGPVVDHPIWYINTLGLPPSIISEITVLKYKKVGGPVEGTECSVCLSEFQEDETLRLLPKCNHAFHISCIDTWLRSHTNCPLCRAPIVKNPAARASSSSSTLESNNEILGARENTRVDIVVENNGGSEDEVFERRNINGTDQEAGELQLEERRIRTDQDSNEIQPIRRSVSLDSISASKIFQSLGNFVPKENTRKLNTHFAKERDLSTKIVPMIVGRSESLLRFMVGSSIGRSLQNAPVSLKRSFSCSGKFLLSRSR